MKRFITLALAVAVLATTLVFAQRQRGGGGGGTMTGAMLLGKKSVQAELKITDDQLKKVEDLSAKQREAFAGLRDLSREERGQKIAEMAKTMDKDAAAILQPDQQKRLKQIT